MLCIVGWGVKKIYCEKFFDMALGGMVSGFWRQVLKQG